MTLPSLTRLAAPALLAAALAAASPVSADPVARPFKAQLATYEVLSIDPERCTFDVANPNPLRFLGRTTGRGVASHLGAVAFTASDCVTPVDIGTFQFGPGNDVGSFTLVAANGDHVIGTYSGLLVPSAAAAPASHLVDGNYSITGGTGRFAGASGTGRVQGRLLIDGNPVQPTASGVIELIGTIGY